jgi:periplasmic copper chaperone A
MKTVLSLACMAALLTLAQNAAAHLSLESPHAISGSYAKLVMKLGHGCEGTPTVKVRIQIPEGVTSVKPMQKPQWKVETVKGKLATPLDDGHGHKITEGIKEVVWSGGRVPEENYDEFVMHVKLPDQPNQTLYFPSVQECVKGVHRWIEIPAAGKTSRDYKEPAPALRLVPRPRDL